MAGARAFLWDDMLKGFGVMVTASGVRSYILQYRIGGRGFPTKRATIGQHGNPWTAEKARERAIELLELVRRKIDPVEHERARLGEQREQRKVSERLAFGAYADTFVKIHARGQKLRSADDIEAVIRRDLKPWFKDTSLPRIKRSDVRAMLDDVGARSPSAANKAHKWLRKLLAWAVDRGDLAASPMEGMSAPHKEGQRKRVLRGDELQAVWLGADAMGHPFGSLVQLLLLTGQRLREVAGMTWEEVDMPGAVWRIPGERTKNGHDHLCPLNPQAMARLHEIQPIAAKRKGFILTTNGKTPIAGFSKAKVALDSAVAKLRPDSGLEPWVFHDLRRSLATGCQALGVPIEHTEAVLNHVSGKRGGLAGVYQLHEYQSEKTFALTAWGAHVEECVKGEPKGSNVIALAERRA